MTTSIECTVSFRAGAYITSTVAGQRASSTADARTAVERLAEKLLGNLVCDVFPVPNKKNLAFGSSTWAIRSCPPGSTDQQDGAYVALKNSMDQIMVYLGLDPENLPSGSYSEIVIGAIQAHQRNYEVTLHVPGQAHMTKEAL